jgi:hypothetical protein
MAYLISHLFSPIIPKAFRPRSSVLVLTITIPVSKQFLFLKSWYSQLIVFSVVVFATIPDVVEPPELFQLKCPSHALEAATHLNRNNSSVPQI